jgi:hypothetical protein
LERAVEEDPAAEAFEAWLMNYSHNHPSAASAGAVAAIARNVFEEWQLAHSSEEFRTWLERGAPSDDAKSDKAE